MAAESLAVSIARAARRDAQRDELRSAPVGSTPSGYRPWDESGRPEPHEVNR